MSSESRPSILSRLFRHNGFRWVLILIAIAALLIPALLLGRWVYST
jgi:hypothetical protein